MISLNFSSFVVCTLVSFFCLYFFKKNKILLDQTNYSKHKKLALSSSSRPPLIGGIIIFICSLFFFNQLIILKIFSIGILIIGIFSDINKIIVPRTRILLQFFLILFFVILSDLNIIDLRVNFLNNLLNIKYISIIFTVFCFLILINGTNLLDGLNTLVVGYYILVLSTLIFAANLHNLIINPNIFFLLIFLIVVYSFNFFGYMYLGDSGSYLVSFITAIFLIDFVLMNNDVSPYFIALLLWYPAFENLFSILRRLSLKKLISKADQSHLHQIFFKYFIKKNFFNKHFTNSITANIINLYNLLIFAFFYKYVFVTKFLIFIIIFNIILYLIFYYFMKKKA